MARPNRNTRRRVPLLPSEPSLPLGQPPVPTVPGGPVSTTTTTQAPAGPPAPTTTTVPSTQPSVTTTVPVTTTTTMVPPTTVAASTEQDRSPEALNGQQAVADEITQTFVEIAINSTNLYPSVPLGFISVPQGMAGPVEEYRQVVPLQTPEGEDIGGIMGPSGQLIQNIVTTQYLFNPEYLPEDPWLRYTRQIEEFARSQVGSENAPEFDQLSESLQRSLGPRRIDPEVFRLATAESINQELIEMSLEDYNVIRTALVTTGLLDQNKIGDWTSKGIPAEVFNAAKEAGRLGNTDGLNWINYLMFKANMGATLGDALSQETGTGPAMPTIRVTSADDLKVVLDRTSRNYFGRGLSDEEMTPIIREIQNRESEAQRAQFYGSGGTVEATPSAAALAEQQVQEQFGQEYDVYQMGNYLDVFRQMLGGQR